jgi:hypothetical protein
VAGLEVGCDAAMVVSEKNSVAAVDLKIAQGQLHPTKSGDS